MKMIKHKGECTNYFIDINGDVINSNTNRKLKIKRWDNRDDSEPYVMIYVEKKEVYLNHNRLMNEYYGVPLRYVVFDKRDNKIKTFDNITKFARENNMNSYQLVKLTKLVRGEIDEYQDYKLYHH